MRVQNDPELTINGTFTTFVFLLEIVLSYALAIQTGKSWTLRWFTYAYGHLWSQGLMLDLISHTDQSLFARCWSGALVPIWAMILALWSVDFVKKFHIRNHEGVRPHTYKFAFPIYLATQAVDLSLWKQNILYPVLISGKLWCILPLYKHLSNQSFDHAAEFWPLDFRR